MALLQLIVLYCKAGRNAGFLVLTMHTRDTDPSVHNQKAQQAQPFVGRAVYRAKHAVNYTPESRSGVIISSPLKASQFARASHL